MFFPPLQPETRGSVNGISQSLVAIGRSVGPVLGSVLFAWSASSGKWLKSYMYVCACMLGLFNGVLTAWRCDHNYRGTPLIKTPNLF